MIYPIISVHTPKVAGTSFQHQLQRAFGEEKVLFDYRDDPVDVLCRMNIDPQYFERNPIHSIAPYKVVHGHFHVAKYSYLENSRRITFLRHPVDNVFSIYRYWKSHQESDLDGPIFKYFKRNNCSLEELAMIPKIRYLYTESYFAEVDMTSFEFVGDFSSYEEELARLGRVLGVPFFSDLRVNVTSERNGYSDEPLTAKMRKFLECALASDIRFYERYAGR